MTTPPNVPMKFAPPEVLEAKADNLPIVALESTIITHGMPFPQNVETARLVEATVRENGGAVPATMAVIDGTLHIGLTGAELDSLGGQAKNVAKLSRADFAACIAAGGTGGATTVAATMIAARLAGGIEVFATGGIGGGVHRGGAESSFDISADLSELAQTAVTVVAAGGAKAILDIPKTLEVLETSGVPVITFGQDDFPAFWSQSSGLPSPLRMDEPLEIAKTHRMRAAMGGLPGGAAHCESDPPRRSRNPPPRDPGPPGDRRRPGRGRGAGHRGETGHALPAGPYFPRHRRRIAQGQYRAGEEQCGPGGANCGATDRNVLISRNFHTSSPLP